MKIRYVYRTRSTYFSAHYNFFPRYLELRNMVVLKEKNFREIFSMQTFYQKYAETVEVLK